MSPSCLASGTLKSLLSLCLALSSTITPVLSAPTQAESSSLWTPRSLASLFKPRAATCDGTGVLLTNYGATKEFSFWTNNADDSRTMVKKVSVDGGDTRFIPLDSDWDGTVQRGVSLPATWVEMHLLAEASGDVSLQQGCDGAATLSSTTSSDSEGFTKNINENSNIPAGALFNPATQSTPCYNDGGANLNVQCTTSATNVLDTTTGNFWGAANTLSADYIESQLGGSTEAMEKAFVGTSDWNTTPQVTSSKPCFAVAFY